MSKLLPTNAMLHAMHTFSDQQVKCIVLGQRMLSALAGPCTDHPLAQVAPQRALPRHPSMQGWQWRLLYSPFWEVFSSAAVVPQEVNSLFSVSEMDSEAGWILQMKAGVRRDSCLSCPWKAALLGKNSQPFLLSCAGTQEAPDPCKGAVLSLL